MPLIPGRAISTVATFWSAGWKERRAGGLPAPQERCRRQRLRSLVKTTRPSGRFSRRCGGAPRLVGLAVVGASFVFFVLGAVLQRETDVVSFGDPRHE